MKIIDIGINLMHKSFAADREQVVKRAEEAGVSPLILTGTSLRNSEEAAKYAQKHQGKLFSTAGVHPHDAKHCNEATIRRLKELATLPEVVAIGECGLDFNRDFSPRNMQLCWFEEQVKLACELNMPLFLHEREAFFDFSRVLRNYREALKNNRAVVHCFTGQAQELDAYLAEGFYIGITGWICDERRGKHLRQLVKRIPLDRLMIETDAPFLTPRDLKVKPADGRNEPMFLPHILQTVADCMGISVEQVAEATTNNATLFFQLPIK